MKKEKVAWVFPGGGSHGAWQMAAVKRYLQDNPDETPDIVAGVSVGVLNGVLVCQEKDPMVGVDKGLEVWKGLRGWWDIYRPDWKTATALFSFLSGVKILRNLFPEGLFNTKPLRKLLETHVDPQKIKDLNRKFIVGAVNMSTSKYVRFDEQSPHLLDAMLASSAFPWLFRPVTIDGEPYLDGGLRNKTPLQGAASFNPTKTVVFMTGSMRSIEHLDPLKFAGMYKSLERIFGILFDEAWRDDLINCVEHNPAGSVVIVFRPEPLRSNPLSFKKENHLEMIEEVLSDSGMYKTASGPEALELLKKARIDAL